MTMAYLVVSPSEEKDRGYEVHHFEVKKSRYHNQVTCLHPYKTTSVTVAALKERPSFNPSRRCRAITTLACRQTCRSVATSSRKKKNLRTKKIYAHLVDKLQHRVE